MTAAALDDLAARLDQVALELADARSVVGKLGKAAPSKEHTACNVI